MVAFLHRQRLNLPIALLAGVVAGILVALLFALLPTATIEDLSVESGIASVVAAAAPPLGYTARFALIVFGGGAAGGLVWLALRLAIGDRTFAVEAGFDDGERMPVLRRADAHPDAPARRPLSALRDLGAPGFEPLSFPPIDDADVKKLEEAASIAATPLGEIPEIPLPADLDQPLAAFDPAAIPDTPSEWTPAPPSLTVVPRKQVFEDSERFETFELAPLVRRTPSETSAAPASPTPRVDPSDSIHALLDRLERSVGKSERHAVSSEPRPLPIRRADSIEDALVSLRRLAIRA